MLIHIHLVLIPFLLLLTAIFAASEAALFSLSRTQLETIRLSRPATYERIRRLVERPDALLSTIIVGNECLSIMIGTLTTSYLSSSYPELKSGFLIAASVIASSVMILTTSEILPKVLAFRLPVLLASILSVPMSGFHFVLAPVRKIFLFVSQQICRLFGIESGTPTAVNEKDFLMLVEVGAESGSLNRDEKEMIANVFHFSDRSVASVMTPWNKVFCISEKLPVREILDRVKSNPFSRIPLVSETDSRVVGILYTKELLKFLVENPDSQSPEALQSAIFLPYIVSSHKKISKLFREFKLKKVHIALVVDEYGKHLGVVTLEDLLNALFQTGKRAEVTSS